VEAPGIADHAVAEVLRRARDSLPGVLERREVHDLREVSVTSFPKNEYSPPKTCWFRYASSSL